jgi:hypothetical protein
MFYNTRGIELTLELHLEKQLPQEQLQANWAENQQSLLRYMELVRRH